MVSDDDSDSDLDSDIEAVADDGLDAVFSQLCEPASLRQDARLAALSAAEDRAFKSAAPLCCRVAKVTVVARGGAGRGGGGHKAAEAAAGGMLGAGTGSGSSHASSGSSGSTGAGRLRASGKASERARAASHHKRPAPVSTACGMNLGLGLVACSAESIGGRHSMEDAIALLPDLGAAGDGNVAAQGWFGVYDGHNGAQTSAFLKTHLHATVVAHPEFTKEPQAAITAGFVQADDRFLDHAASQGVYAGSTACALLVRRKMPGGPITLYCGNVGALCSAVGAVLCAPCCARRVARLTLAPLHAQPHHRATCA